MAQDGSQETTAIGWEQSPRVPNTYPNPSSSATSGQFRQYGPAEPLGVAMNPGLAGPWTTSNSLQLYPPYDKQFHNHDRMSPVCFNAFRNYSAPMDFYPPPVLSFLSGGSTALAYPPEYPFPLDNTMSLAALQVPSTYGGTFLNSQDIRNQNRQSISNDIGILQNQVTATDLGLFHIDPDETVCYGVVSQPQILVTKAAGTSCYDSRGRTAQ